MKKKILKLTLCTTLESFNDAKITSINFDRSGEALVIGDSTGTISIYDIEKGQRLRSIRAHTK